ncbi:MAG TPA: T9SS type A sorting domain-containing protein [Bacteroidia bacterium]|nr:T9SS type A sorting domain-containing protein [Bacteroidia bacterium]
MKYFKLIYTVFAMILLSEISFAQEWQWVSPGGGSNGDAATLICHDAIGNYYVGGEYYSDPAIFGNDTLHLNGNNEMYLAKYNSSGQIQWTISFGSNSVIPNEQDNISYLIFRPHQNSLLIGGFHEGTMTIGNYTLYGSGGFIAELSLNGVFNWAKSLSYSCLCVAENGDIFTQHSFSQDWNIDTMYVSAGLWFARFDPEGNLQWAKRKCDPQVSGISGMEFAFFQMSERNGKITGYGNARVDTLQIDTVTVYTYSYYQSILACFDTSGTALWLKPIGSTPEIPAFDFVQDSKGNNFITSTFHHAAIFGSDTIFPPSALSYDAFIAKYDSIGRFLWVKQMNSDSENSPLKLAIDNFGGLIQVGFFKGSIVLNSDTLFSNGFVTYYVVRFDSTGDISYFNINDEIGINNLEIDSSEYITACGVFQNTADFNGTSLTSNGMVDAFIARSSPLTAIEENTRQQNNQLVIYANPNQGRCKLEIPDEFVHERSLLLQIFDNTGRMIQQTQVIMSEDKVRVNLEAEAKGIYNVTLSNKKKSYQGKIVFE